MTELETEEIACELIIKPALHIMEARLPMALLNVVNAHIDSVRDIAADHSKSLVGQIRQNSVCPCCRDRGDRKAIRHGTRISRRRHRE